MKSKIILILVFIFLSALYSDDGITLSGAYYKAIENNNELKKRVFENFASKKRVDQMTSLLLPKINIQASYNLEEYKKDNFSKSKRRIDESFYKYGIDLSQNIFNYPLLKEMEQEKLRFEGTSLEYEATKQDLAKKVTKAYFDYAYSKEVLKLSKLYEESSRLRYHQIEKSLQLGLVNKIDMLEAKVRYDEASLEVNRAKRQIDISKLVLSSIVGEEIETKSGFANINLDFFINVDLNLFEDVYRNLEYKQNLIATQISKKEYSKRKGERLPVISLNAGYYNQDYLDDKNFNDENNKIEVMVRFTMPIFTSGLISSKIEEAQFLNLAGMEQEKSVQKDIVIKQKQTVNEFIGYLSEYGILKQSVEHASVYETFVQKGYEEGLRSLVDVLDAKFRVFKAKNDLLNSQYKIIITYLELQGLIGNISLQTIQELDRIIEFNIR